MVIQKQLEGTAMMFLSFITATYFWYLKDLKRLEVMRLERSEW